MKNNFHHIPVMLSEAVEALKISEGEKYIDATLGGGGHTKEIIRRGGYVLGIDRDQDALDFVSEDQASNIAENKLRIAKGNFNAIKEIAHRNGFDKVGGVLFDLGVSSYQIDQSGRGFSIKRDEKLDMRMSAENNLSAYEVVNSYPYEGLVEIFYRYGEEHNARPIAEAIVEARKNKHIETTRELAALVEKIPHKSEAIHPATRVFQAIRIEVNEELGSLKKALEESVSLLSENGRVVVISFHSLEDRIVKQAFERFKREGKGVVVTKKPLIATEQERSANRRARSAKLRIFEYS